MGSTLNIEENVPLAPLTTFKIGGNAKLFARACSEHDVIAAFEFATTPSIPLFILGGGSNVLIADNGFDGLVLQNGIKGVREISDGQDGMLIEVGAGEDWDGFVAHAVGKRWAGVECLSGIPGLVGGTPVQNVGAYGQDVSETIVSVRCLDRQTGKILTLSNSECEFQYRQSIFNSNQRDRFIVLNVLFMLRPHGIPKIAYRDLVDRFEGHEASLAEVRDAVMEIRRSKSMVIDPTDPNSRSAGSFFKNPVVSSKTFEEIRTSFPDIPHFETGDQVKIPAAWLIEKAGFSKGFVAGEAGISSKHTLAIINRGSARAEEIVVLMKRIKGAVEREFGIELTPEPIFIGF